MPEMVAEIERRYLADIKARCEAATDGPWRAIVRHGEEEGTVDGIESQGNAGSFDIVRTDSGVYPPSLDDAEFIAHARVDLPTLLAYVEHLRSGIKAVADQLAAGSSPDERDAAAEHRELLFRSRR